MGSCLGMTEARVGTLEPRRSLEALIRHLPADQAGVRCRFEGGDLVGLGRHTVRTDPRLVPSTHSGRTHTTNALPSGLTGFTDHARVRNYSDDQREPVE